MERYASLRRWIGPWAVAIAVAAGAVLAWFIAFGFVGYWILVFRSVASVPSESLVFTVEGEPLTVRYLPAIDAHETFRLPDGSVQRQLSPQGQPLFQTLGHQMVEVPMALQAGAFYPLPGPDHRQMYYSPPWILSFRAPGERHTYWYLIVSDEGFGHFAGFDPESKLPAGYIGTKGLRSQFPPEGEQFRMDTALLAANAAMLPNDGRWGSEPDDTTHETPLLADGTVYQVDFARNTVTPIALPAKVLAIGEISVPTIPEGSRGLSMAPRRVARMAESIAVLDLAGKVLRSVPIPAEARSKPLSLYGTLDSDMVLVAGEGERDIYRINDEGAVVRKERYVPPMAPPSDWFPVTLAAFPFPLTWVAKPLISVGASDPGWSRHWLGWLVVFGIAAACAVACYRRQRSVYPATAWPWAAMVFVLGPAGLVGYWAHRRWPSRALPPEPRPASRGIEVFA